MLYLLIITDDEKCYDNYSEDFYIGYFFDKCKAEKTAEYYLNNIKGFSEFPCSYRIVEKEVIGDKSDITEIWIVQGWNENENYDEIDIVESECYTTKSAAKIELERMQLIYQRKEWTINKLEIGKLEWQEGFCRFNENEEQI